MLCCTACSPGGSRSCVGITARPVTDRRPTGCAPRLASPGTRRDQAARSPAHLHGIRGRGNGPQNGGAPATTPGTSRLRFRPAASLCRNGGSLSETRRQRRSPRLRWSFHRLAPNPPPERVRKVAGVEIACRFEGRGTPARGREEARIARIRDRRQLGPDLGLAGPRGAPRVDREGDLADETGRGGARDVERDSEVLQESNPPGGRRGGDRWALPLIVEQPAGGAPASKEVGPP